MDEIYYSIDRHESSCRLADSPGDTALIKFSKTRSVSGLCSSNPELKMYIDFKREIPEPVLAIYDVNGVKRIVLSLSENIGAKVAVIEEDKLSLLNSGVHYALLLSGEEIVEIKRFVIFGRDDK